MIVVSLCDKTGVMVKPWADAGFECVCVDVQHSIRRPRVNGRIRYEWGDVRSWEPTARPIIVFAFPPCTDLAVSGARDFVAKGGYRLADSLEIAEACKRAAAWSGVPWMIENPVGRLSSCWRKPDATFNPCDYGGYRGGEFDGYTKKTCIWHGGGFRMPKPNPIEPEQGSKMHTMPPSNERANLRSVTPAGFAQAVYEANVAGVIARGGAA